ncbi:hypothetical protein SAMN05421736_11476 [Evansella caseinilytica]|uniref:Uncharacterized protein n=1 Tax=Evansella caseinilytica TaxID=1503961 RepID=A0A1H3TEN4_9BACI|nr:hypothetical protein [Evansella caseinilytica]SDZ48763.1 hypothetical protein SAMN05421736_11476 [Evansella caseinilytica]
MNLKIKALLFFCCLVGGALFTTTQVLADSPENPVIYAEDFADEEELYEKVTELLNDPNVEGVSVINEEQSTPGSLNELTAGSVASREQVSENNVGILSAWLRPGQYRTHGPYRIQRINNGKDTYGSTINKVAGDPGVTIKLDYSKSVAASHTSTFGLDLKYVNAAVGFNTTRSYTVSYSGSIKVPKKNNGKKVKRLTMEAKPIFENRHLRVWHKREYKGVTTAKKPVGIYYKKVFTYK